MHALVTPTTSCHWHTGLIRSVHCRYVVSSGNFVRITKDP